MADSIPSTLERQLSRESRPAVIIAALLYLIAAYQRTPCPCVALCIVRHLDYLSGHEGADPVIRQICEAVRKTWALAAADPRLAHAVPRESAQDVSCPLLH